MLPEIVVTGYLTLHSTIVEKLELSGAVLDTPMLAVTKRSLYKSCKQHCATYLECGSVSSVGLCMLLQLPISSCEHNLGRSRVHVPLNQCVYIMIAVVV